MSFLGSFILKAKGRKELWLPTELSKEIKSIKFNQYYMWRFNDFDMINLVQNDRIQRPSWEITWEGDGVEGAYGKRGVWIDPWMIYMGSDMTKIEDFKDNDLFEGMEVNGVPFMRPGSDPNFPPGVTDLSNCYRDLATSDIRRLPPMNFEPIPLFWGYTVSDTDFI